MLSPCDIDVPENSGHQKHGNDLLPVLADHSNDGQPHQMDSGSLLRARSRINWTPPITARFAVATANCSHGTSGGPGHCRLVNSVSNVVNQNNSGQTMTS